MARKSQPRGREQRNAPVQIQFEDNRVLAQLFGEHDRNIAVLEPARRSHRSTAI
jgi:hypothetical protein